MPPELRNKIYDLLDHTPVARYYENLQTGRTSIQIEHHALPCRQLYSECVIDRTMLTIDTAGACTSLAHFIRTIERQSYRFPKVKTLVIE